MQETGAHPSRVAPHEEPMRVLTLTDGVFAIVMTILVLEIHVPAAMSAHNLELWFVEHGEQTLLLYMVSFLFTGFFWTGHRRLFSFVERVDHGLVWLNVIFLMFVGLLPFCASLLIHYPSLELAQQCYGTVLFALSVWRLYMFQYVAVRPHLLTRPMPPGTVRRLVPVMLFAPVGYVGFIFMTPPFPILSFIACLLAPVAYILYLNRIHRSLALDRAQRLAAYEAARARHERPSIH